MADRDFKINIVTLADLTGIKLTQQQLEALQTAAANGNKQAIGALNQLAAAQKKAQSELNVGFTGSAIGVGTIVSLVTGAIRKWEQFNAEQDKMVEHMIQVQEKMRALGDSIIDIQDDMISLRRIGAEPLEQSLQRLQHELEVLKTEQSLLNLPSQGDEWKKLNAEITKHEALIERVTGAIAKQKDVADKSAKDREKAAEKRAKDDASFMENALKSSSDQTKAVLMNEEAARKARETGDERSAGLFEKSAEALKRGMTQAQREEYEGLTKTPPVGRKAEEGESQEVVDQMEKNRINFERQLQGQKPLPEGQPNTALLEAIQDLNVKMDEQLRIWR